MCFRLGNIRTHGTSFNPFSSHVLSVGHFSPQDLGDAVAAFVGSDEHPPST